jgi:SAM-dependent methyltransferase
MPLRSLSSTRFREAQLAELAAWAPRISNHEHIRYELIEHSEVVAPFRSLFADRRFRKGLDVGVGPYGLGFLGPHLRHQIEDIHGLDPLPRLKLDVHDEALRHLVDEIRARTAYIQGLGEYIPVPEGAYDIVACINVVDHAQDPSRIVAEIKRVLKPGGVLIFGVNTLSLLGELKWTLMKSVRPERWLFRAHPHTFIYSRAEQMIRSNMSPCRVLWKNPPTMGARLAGHGRMSFWIVEKGA